MIDLLVQESTAFDMLTVLQIKANEFPTESNKQQLEWLFRTINSQIKEDLLTQIFYSKEYQDLYNINNKIFWVVEKLNKGDEKSESITAKYVNDLNNERYLMKKKIQETFFNTKLQEFKTNYV